MSNAPAGTVGTSVEESSAIEIERVEGFASYETYCVHKWLADPDVHPDTEELKDWCYWQGNARQCLGESPRGMPVWDGTGSVPEAPRRHLAEWVREDLIREAPVGMIDMYAELMLSALERVDWDELAEVLLREVGPKNPDPEEGGAR